MYYVPTDQRLGILATYLLEPASEDGFVSWNFFDRDLRPGTIYPVTRLREPLLRDLEVVTDTPDSH